MPCQFCQSKATKHNGSIINSRRGSRENGDRFSITETVKMWPSNEDGRWVREHVAPEKRLGFNPLKCHSLLYYLVNHISYTSSDLDPFV